MATRVETLFALHGRGAALRGSDSVACGPAMHRLDAEGSQLLRGGPH